MREGDLASEGEIGILDDEGEAQKVYLQTFVFQMMSCRA